METWIKKKKTAYGLGGENNGEKTLIFLGYANGVLRQLLGVIMIGDVNERECQ